MEEKIPLYRKIGFIRLLIIISLILNIITGSLFWGGWCGFFFYLPAIIIMILFNTVLLLMTIKLKYVIRRIYIGLLIFILSQTLYGISGFIGSGDAIPHYSNYTTWRGEWGSFGINYYLKTDVPEIVFEIIQIIAIILFLWFTLLLINFVIDQRRNKKKAVGIYAVGTLEVLTGLFGFSQFFFPLGYIYGADTIYCLLILLFFLGIILIIKPIFSIIPHIIFYLLLFVVSLWQIYKIKMLASHVIEGYVSELESIPFLLAISTISLVSVFIFVLFKIKRIKKSI